MKKYFFIFLFLGFADVGRSAALCLEAFANGSAGDKRDGTDDLIAYLGSLLEEQIMGDVELARFIRGLEGGKASNPISEKQARSSSAALLHQSEIQEYLNETQLNHEVLLQWAIQKFKEKEQIKSKREAVRVETQGLHQKMIFYPIPPGRFLHGERFQAKAVDIEHAFEMMSTKVTQRHWLDLMGENPSYFKGQDNPVEYVTWWSAIAFANKLSQKRGLKPAYLLMNGFIGKAEDGSLNGEDRSYVPQARVIINAPGGNIYQTEGYRLPTLHEHEYVRKNLGRAPGKYYFGDDVGDLKDHAWYQGNSNFRTHPVAELKPLVIGDGKFFDLYGNVSEWASEWYIFGSDWVTSGRNCASNARALTRPNHRSSNVGFRLVRSIK